MRHDLLLAALLTCFGPVIGEDHDQTPDANVNSRYRVESVALSGIAESRVSKELLEAMQRLVGEQYNQDAAHALARRLRKELPDYSVTVKLRRGNEPERVQVVYTAERTWWKRFEVPVTPVVYHSKQGWSGTLDICMQFGHSAFTLGFVNSADELLERNAGYRFRYVNRKVGTDVVQLRLDFDTYHQKWNPATEAALAGRPDVPGIYRSRQNFSPSVSLIPARDLKLSIGISFQRFQTQYPVTRTGTAYAGTAGIQYRRRVQDDGRRLRHDFSAGYDLRAATRVMDSDLVYTRHVWTASYRLSRGRHRLGARFQGGLIHGEAPLFERFSLGSSAALRGWNKFDVAPLGGARSAYGTLDYRYRPFEVFYDLGRVWDSGQPARLRHALGFGLAFKGGFFMSLGFPVRLHAVAPVFMVGLNH